MEQNDVVQSQVILLVQHILDQVWHGKIVGDDKISQLFFPDRMLETARFECFIRCYEGNLSADHVQCVHHENRFRGRGT